MKKLGFACLAFGALAGGHPMLADAFEPVWLTENEMEMRSPRINARTRSRMSLIRGDR